METLGCTSVICSDKTGTITENRMTVTKIITLDQEFDVTGNALKKEGAILENQHPISVKQIPALESLLTCAVLCNNAELSEKDASEWSAVGDPTETALLAMAAKGGISAKILNCSRLEEDPFDSDTRCMSVLMQNQNQRKLYVKGALDTILQQCDFVRTRSGDQPLTISMKKQISAQAEKLSSQALRVLAFAEKKSDSLTKSGLIYTGITGMLDPPRPEAKEAIRKCASASVRTVMITGDHKKTAQYWKIQGSNLR